MRRMRRVCRTVKGVQDADLRLEHAVHRFRLGAGNALKSKTPIGALINRAEIRQSRI
jgi:hypothetical protein